MGRVLVAEDNGPLRQLLVEVLGAAGHEVVAAADGREALSIAEAEQPDLLVTDYLMPSMDGVDLARRLWSRPGLGSLPVIVFTAFPIDSKLLPFVEMEQVSYVVKGQRLTQLLRTIDEMMGSGGHQN